MSANFADPLSLTGVARRVGLSADHLSRLLRAHAGAPFRPTLMGLRMRAAERLLASTWCGAKEVAALVGFPDRSHFVRRFAARHGVGPAEYQRRAHAGATGHRAGCPIRRKQPLDNGFDNQSGPCLSERNTR